MPARLDQAPQTFDELLGALQQTFACLTPSQKLLAERVMSDPEGTAFMTISEMAAAVGVNEATVVRFATSLGLSGYPGLTRLCQERLREQAQLLHRFANLEQLGDGSRDPLELANRFDQANIVRTFARIDRSSWSAAVHALATAARVQVMGLRKCHSIAFLLGYLLRLVRDDVEVPTLAAGTLTDDLRRLRRGDCFVGVSIHRYSADTVKAFRWAQRVGATTIALTDNPSSPLALHATHTFYVDTAGVAVLRSVTAFTALAQALATAVATERGTDARSGLLVEEDLLEFYGVYAADDTPAVGASSPPPTADHPAPRTSHPPARVTARDRRARR